ncbi:hypothetical protein DNTS_007940 [Danionella cerebrum]|uniref:R3H domain-containing protein n=1 Tax=Danionella cerebrum TaxID=2873325 RepID=A0A553RMI9_9TELE|nr:hypothetical protein DNTS_007940 [Danionella translucida]
MRRRFNQDCFNLNLILGASVNRELEDFTNKLRVKSSSNLQEKEELSLGIYPDKNLRAVIHKAVRFNFPFLQTVTNQTEIQVREDPDGEAEDFFRFIDAKSPGSSCSFLPDDSKEHRTSVHHFVSKRFGKLVETKSFTEQEKMAIRVRLRERGKPSKKRTMADCCEHEMQYTGDSGAHQLYLSAVLWVLPSDFTYAGIKDKRALTYQAMVVKKISSLPKLISIYEREWRLGVPAVRELRGERVDAEELNCKKPAFIAKLPCGRTTVGVEEELLHHIAGAVRENGQSAGVLEKKRGGVITEATVDHRKRTLSRSA